MNAWRSATRSSRRITPSASPAVADQIAPAGREVKAFLDQYVIGQEKTKKKLAVAVYNHYKRIP